MHIKSDTVQTFCLYRDLKPAMQSASPPVSDTVPAASEYPPTANFCQDTQLHRLVNCQVK